LNWPFRCAKREKNSSGVVKSETLYSSIICKNQTLTLNLYAAKPIILQAPTLQCHLCTCIFMGVIYRNTFLTNQEELYTRVQTFWVFIMIMNFKTNCSVTPVCYRRSIHHHLVCSSLIFPK
jgi:hypothetical protein